MKGKVYQILLCICAFSYPTFTYGLTVTGCATAAGSAAYTGSAVSWAGFDNTSIAADDGDYAEYTGTGLDVVGEYSNYGLARGFGFAIPANYRILGITVNYRKFAGGEGTVKDRQVRLSTSTSVSDFSATNNASASAWPTTETTVTYGSSTDLWGEAAGGWTVAEVNSANFSVFISIEKATGSDDSYAYIDNACVTLTYTYPLPITLTSFIAKNIEDKFTLIEWTTGTEVLNDFVEVQRSLDGINWLPIDTIQGAGDKYTLSRYSIKDTNPEKGINYYRLRQVDYDGTVSYSNINAVTFCKLAFYVSIYPNPASDHIQVRLPSNIRPKEELHFELIDVHGQLIRSFSTTAENATTPISLNSVSQGVYFVSVSSRRARYSEKIMVE